MSRVKANIRPEQFAKTEAMYVVVRLLQTFDRIENMEAPGQCMLFHHTIENRSGTGVQVRLHAVGDRHEPDDMANDFEPLRKESVHNDAVII